MRRSRHLVWALLLVPWARLVEAGEGSVVWRFTDVTDAAGVTSAHGYVAGPHDSLSQRAAGGVAAGDYDGDGRADLYVIGGDAGRNLLFHNQGDGTFVEVGRAAGVAVEGVSGSGPLFFDADGDGRLDLFVGAVDGGGCRLFRNRGDGSFDDVTSASGLDGPEMPVNTLSATAYDYDGDGWLDLFLGHWQSPVGGCHLWRNQGGGRFACADGDAGLAGVVRDVVDETFTGNFADLDGDGRPDLVVTADVGQSTVWLGRAGGRFELANTPVISDENGMGSAVGDYDGDGDLDWFVASIFDGDGVTEGDWGTTGNRLYKNVGGGHFADATDAAGVRDGNWGWGSSFSDLDNDGWLDLVQVDGWPQGSPQFRDQPDRLFVGSASGRFQERALELGFDDRGQGRGVVAFDYDGDGDLDVFVANNDGPHHLWRNDGGRASGHALFVSVEGEAPNLFSVGALVKVTAGGRTQVREVRAGTNYASQDPLEVHFGLGDAARVDRVEVTWPDGARSAREGVAADQRIVVSRPSPAELAARAAGAGCG
jgi:hypothetical protein